MIVKGSSLETDRSNRGSQLRPSAQKKKETQSASSVIVRDVFGSLLYLRDVVGSLLHLTNLTWVG